MTTLSSGSLSSWPKGWGIPSPVLAVSARLGGMVWHGRNPATDEDIDAICAWFGGREVNIDEASLVGRDDPAYSTFYRDNKHLSRVSIKLN